MVKYDGITEEAFWLLAQNRFHNSKDYYEANKEDIKRLAINPMRQIAASLAPDMLKIDPRMNLNPVKMVSRIRRDTRFTRDKTLYRENVWIMFMRPKIEWPLYPCMWFEISPKEYSYGVGHFETTPSLMETYRGFLIEHREEFLDAVKKAKKTKAVFYADYYKKPVDGSVPDDLQTYWSVKNMGFITRSTDKKALENDAVIQQLRTAYKNFSPMYDFFRKASDAYLQTA